jgi:hypothetical protein
MPISYFLHRAQIAGLELRELNALEREFLVLLDFRLAVRHDEYDAYAAALAAVGMPATTPSGSTLSSTAISADVVAAHTASARSNPRVAARVRALVAERTMHFAGPLSRTDSGSVAPAG